MNISAADLLGILKEPTTREAVQRMLGLPSEPVAESLRELIAAQERTEQNLAALSAEVKTLAQAQKRTDETVAALSAEMKALSAEVKALSAEMKALSAEVRDLAQSVQTLARGQRDLAQAVGALSDNVGFGLEELAAIVLPGVLEREEGVRVANFVRRFFRTESGDEEVDLFAEGERGTSPLVVVGEVKSRIYSGDVHKFAAKIQRLAVVLPAEVLPLLFGFVVHPTARDAARALGVRVVASRPG